MPKVTPKPRLTNNAREVSCWKKHWVKVTIIVSGVAALIACAGGGAAAVYSKSHAGTAGTQDSNGSSNLQNSSPNSTYHLSQLKNTTENTPTSAQHITKYETTENTPTSAQDIAIHGMTESTTLMLDNMEKIRINLPLSLKSPIIVANKKASNSYTNNAHDRILKLATCPRALLYTIESIYEYTISDSGYDYVIPVEYHLSVSAYRNKIRLNIPFPPAKKIDDEILAEYLDDFFEILDAKNTLTIPNKIILFEQKITNFFNAITLDKKDYSAAVNSLKNAKKDFLDSSIDVLYNIICEHKDIFYNENDKKSIRIKAFPVIYFVAAMEKSFEHFEKNTEYDLEILKAKNQLSLLTLYEKMLFKDLSSDKDISLNELIKIRQQLQQIIQETEEENSNYNGNIKHYYDHVKMINFTKKINFKTGFLEYLLNLFYGYNVQEAGIVGIERNEKYLKEVIHDYIKEGSSDQYIGTKTFFPSFALQDHAEYKTMVASEVKTATQVIKLKEVMESAEKLKVKDAIKKQAISEIFK